MCCAAFDVYFTAINWRSCKTFYSPVKCDMFRLMRITWVYVFGSFFVLFLFLRKTAFQFAVFPPFVSTPLPLTRSPPAQFFFCCLLKWMKKIKVLWAVKVEYNDCLFFERLFYSPTSMCTYTYISWPLSIRYFLRFIYFYMFVVKNSRKRLWRDGQANC